MCIRPGRRNFILSWPAGDRRNLVATNRVLTMEKEWAASTHRCGNIQMSLEDNATNIFDHIQLTTTTTILAEAMEVDGAIIAWTKLRRMTRENHHYPWKVLEAFNLPLNVRNTCREINGITMFCSVFQERERPAGRADSAVTRLANFR